MAAYDNSYSRFVSWAKILLPLAALALLSTIFLLARGVDTSGSIPFAEVDVDEIAREQRISAPNYSGVTEDGAALTISASAARPDAENNDRMTATALDAVIETTSGSYRMTSGSGEIDTAAGQAKLQDGVTITTPSGFEIRSEEMETALSHTDLRSPGPVSATGPTGQLTAGQMTLSAVGEGEEADYLLVFKNGVKLIYTPPSE